jgi:hypothetical protein
VEERRLVLGHGPLAHHLAGYKKSGIDFLHERLGAADHEKMAVDAGIHRRPEPVLGTTKNGHEGIGDVVDAEPDPHGRGLFGEDLGPLAARAECEAKGAMQSVDLHPQAGHDSRGQKAVQTCGHESDGPDHVRIPAIPAYRG